LVESLRDVAPALNLMLIIGALSKMSQSVTFVLLVPSVGGSGPF
jgi:hypothetical protein